MRTCSSPSNTSESYWTDGKDATVNPHAAGTERRAVVTYDFVGHDEKVVFLSYGGNLFELISTENLSDRVVRRVDNNHLRTWRDRAAKRVPAFETSAEPITAKSLTAARRNRWPSHARYAFRRSLGDGGGRRRGRPR